MTLSTHHFSHEEVELLHFEPLANEEVIIISISLYQVCKRRANSYIQHVEPLRHYMKIIGTWKHGITLYNLSTPASVINLTVLLDNTAVTTFALLFH